MFLSFLTLLIPLYFSLQSEFHRKTFQLEQAIISQKKQYIQAVVVEKLSDIEERYNNLTKFYPKLDSNAFEALFRKEVRTLIHKTILPNYGYIWINEILNYDGGDNYAIRFAHPNLVETEGTFLSTNSTDIKGTKPYLVELEGVKEKGWIFFDYFFKKMESEKISQKLTYAHLYKPFNWVVATGVYLDDVNQLVEKEINIMQSATNQSIIIVIVILCIALSLFVMLVIMFEKKLQTLIARNMYALNISNKKLKREKLKLENAYERIEEVSKIDFLTEALNRRAMHEYLILESSRMKRTQSHYGLLLLDIDYFKKINDHFGHETGDFVLKELSRIVTKLLRLEDKLGRWGGEEFLCVITNAAQEHLFVVAEKVRIAIEKHEFIYKGNSIYVTITIGAILFDSKLSIEALIEEADKRLYIGKNNGRNKVIV